MREPNLDPNICNEPTNIKEEWVKAQMELLITYSRATNIKEEWVKAQMQDPVIINEILARAEGPYRWLREEFIWDGKTHEERQKQQQKYCRMFLERQFEISVKFEKDIGFKK